MKASSFSRFTSVLVFVILFALIFSCQEKPFDHPFGNREPDTFITGVTLTPEAASSTWYAYSVTFTGLDTDGQLIAYEYRIGGAAGTWQEVSATTTTLTGRLDFPTGGTEYSIEVRAMDENRVVDSTPAEYTFTTSLFQNTIPTVAFTNAPAQDAVVSGGVVIGVGGSDFGGKLASFRYKLDNEDWKEVYPGSGGTADIVLSYLSEGYHTLLVKSVDNLGGESKTLSRSFYTKLNYFAPTVSSAVPSPGTVIVTGSTITATVNASASYYNGVITGYQFSLDGGDTWTEILPDNHYDITNLVNYKKGDGKVYFIYKIYDNGGGVTSNTVVYQPLQIVEFRKDKKLLVVDGISAPTYGGDYTGFMSAEEMWGNRYKLWWVGHPDNPASGPGNGIIPLGKGQSELPSFIKDCFYYTGNTNAAVECIVWVGNWYAGDETTWANNLDLLVEFMENGGKVLHGGRYWGNWFTDAMETYLELGDAEFSGSQTVTSLDPIISGPPTIHAPEPGLSASSLAHSITTAPTSSAFTAMYKFNNSDTEIGGFYITKGGGVRFASLSGRVYRHVRSEFKAANDWILTNLFSIPPDY